MFALLGLDPINAPPPVDEVVRLPRLTREERSLPTAPAAIPEDQLARQAVAEIESEDGYDACAFHRLRGAYDGDTEHRIAMKAIQLFKQSTRDTGAANNRPVTHK
jgi:hypothetical protein